MPDDASGTDTATTDTTTDATGAGGGGSGDDKTFTQQQVNDLVAREKGNLQRKYDDYDDLKARAAKLDEIEAANQSDLERISGERDDLQSRVEPLGVENLRLRVALDKGLDPDLIDRLQGSTKEELEQDADKLIEKFGDRQQDPNLDGGARGGGSDSQGDMNAAIRQRLGRT